MFPLIAVLQLLYTEGTMSSGFFLKKKPPCTPPDSARELGNRSRRSKIATPRLVAALVLCACATLSGPLRAQTEPAARTVTIRMYDARTGRQLTPSNFLVRFNHQDDLHNESLHIDDDGTGQVAVPADAAFLSVQGTFDNSMDIYFNCDSGMEKDAAKLHWYAISEILATGIIAPNECFKGKYERPRIAVKPGEFIFYVRAHNWRDPSTY
ncbi:MAG TPA: hypothetical protein VGL72_16585 [Bryobacteraceae bacterium]